MGKYFFTRARANPHPICKTQLGVATYTAPVLVNPSNPQFEVTDAELLRPDHLDESRVDRMFSGTDELTSPFLRNYAREYDLIVDAGEGYNGGKVSMASASRVVPAEVEGEKSSRVKCLYNHFTSYAHRLFGC